MTVHADGTQVDLTLPMAMPIAALLPAIADVMGITGVGESPHHGRPAAGAAQPFRLSLPGAAALESSKTLAQHHIRDGMLLLLTRTAVKAPAPRFDDPAELVSTTVRATAQPWTPAAARLTAVLTAGGLAGIGVVLAARSHSAATGGVAAAGAGCALVGAMVASRGYRDTGAALALGLLALGLAAVAGFIIVPGAPGAPGLLLGATAATAVGVLVGQVTGCDGPAVTALCCLSALVAAAALAVVLTGASIQVAGAVSTVASIGLLHAASRISIAAVGLGHPRQPGTGTGAVRAHRLLTGLVAGLAALAVLGVLGTAAGVYASGTPRFGGVVLGTAGGIALLLQTRSHADRSQIIALVAAGITALGGSFVAAAAAAPQQAAWLGAAAGAFAAATLRLGFATPALPPSARRAVDLLEYLVLAALVPLAGWICGWYHAIRSLGLA